MYVLDFKRIQLGSRPLYVSVYIYQFWGVSDNYFSELIILFVSTNIFIVLS